jgi:rifampin ADP-ribosylating transferase
MPAHVWRETLHGLTDARPPTDTAVISAPTLVVWGERDELLTRDQAVGLVEAIPGSRLVVYEETGHLVLWEEPERVAADLVSFVEALGEASV